MPTVRRGDSPDPNGLNYGREGDFYTSAGGSLWVCTSKGRPDIAVWQALFEELTEDDPHTLEEAIATPGPLELTSATAPIVADIVNEHVDEDIAVSTTPITASAGDIPVLDLTTPETETE